MAETPPPALQPDFFEAVLNLEEQYHREGFSLGVADGSRNGRIEGRVFGLQKGFDKFVEMGRLSGRAAVWEARLDRNPSESDSQVEAAPLPRLAGNVRLNKHVSRLAALSDPDNLSTENSEDAVSEFDDRLKDANAKAALLTRLVSEDETVEVERLDAQSQSVKPPVVGLRIRGDNGTTAPRSAGEMEDFAGLPRARQ